MNISCMSIVTLVNCDLGYNFYASHFASRLKNRSTERNIRK